ncbi:MAG: hypothetical protein HY828_11215 [Actinobacteria bacterium]|nr:hypothetical protein [Actinomycetota bacterium]
MTRRSRAMSWGALAVGLASVLASSHHATATTTDEEALAQRHAPVIAVQEHAEECGDGEPFVPAAVESVLDQEGVVLRDANGVVLVDRPTAAYLFTAPADSHLDLPGNALSPGCDYEQWFHRTSGDATPTVYARVATDTEEPGRLVVQYWVFWVYNDWNDRHEGDWEMLQVAFDAADATEALGEAPVEVAVAQHEGSERRPWDRVQLDGDHPVVHPATGSHATYYTADRWFGKSAASGFGCDDTRAPSTRIDPAVVMLPEQASGADDPFAWLQFEGHWGEQQPTFNNGPTGPITKDQWAHPVVWMEEEGRTSSISLPPTGSKVTDFFCTASSRGSLLFIRFLDQPWLVAIVAVIVIGLIVFGIRRTLWSPDHPLPLVEQRHAGQILRGAARLLWEHRRRFVPISMLVLVGGAAAALAQVLVLAIPSVDAFGDIVGKDNTLSVTIALLAGALVSVPVALVTVSAAITLADDIDRGSTEGHVVRRGLRGPALRAAAALLGATLLAALIPIVGLVLVVLWAVAPRAADVDRQGVRAALRRSRHLTKGKRTKTTLVVFVTAVVALLTGPFVGTIVLLLSSASFGIVNLVAALFSSVLLPWLAVVLTLLHGDLTAARQSAA